MAKRRSFELEPEDDAPAFEPEVAAPTPRTRGRDPGAHDTGYEEDRDEHGVSRRTVSERGGRRRVALAEPRPRPAGWPGEVWAIGDAMAPRTCEEAVLEGLKVGSALGGGPLAPIDQPLRIRAVG